MIIDSHVHILPERVRRARVEIGAGEPWFAVCHQGDRVIATERELLEAMDAAGVDRAVCFAWPFADPSLCAEVNEHLAGVQRRNPDRVIAFATVNPATPGAAKEIERCASLGLRGLGELNCDAQGFSLDDPALDAAVQASIETGLVWTLHCSEPVGHEYAGKGTTTPDKVVRFFTRHPELRLICAHLGGGLPFFAHMPEVREVCRRLWFDTAAGPFLYSPSAYREVVELCGAERLLFGSDYPLLNVSRYVKAFAAAGLDDAARRAVMGESAAALLAGG
jgi:predicted TIM-barrel fold metal-dependent hydrolase